MAPPNFPNGMTLHSIGYAALKYPSLPPELPIPIDYQIGALQRVGPSSQNQMIAQIASQYLTALLEYLSSDCPHLQDESSPQAYLPGALCLLNFLTASPDVCVRVAKHPTLFRSVVEKLLKPDFEQKMKACDRTTFPPGWTFPPNPFEEDFGTLLQFVSTILLYHSSIENPHPRMDELIPKLQEWKRRYKDSRCKTISRASERLVSQIRAKDQFLYAQMRLLQEGNLVCGYVSCGKKGDLTACASCRIQRYCCRDHQKKDWKFHKGICNKGLIEEGEGGEGGEGEEGAKEGEGVD